MTEIKQYFPEIDGFKGFLALCIAGFHFEVIFFGASKYFATGFLAVEAFFIISGFLLMHSLQKTSHIDPVKISLNKAQKIYLTYFIALIAMVAASFAIDSHLQINREFTNVFISEALMIQMLGFFQIWGLNYPDWFVSALLIGVLAITFTYRYLKKYFFFLCLFAAITIYTILQGNGTLDAFKSKTLPFMLDGTLRATAGLCVGIVIYYLHQAPYFKSPHPYIRHTLQLASLFWLLTILFRNTASVFDFYILLAFPLLFYTTLDGFGLLSKLLRSRAMVFLGKLSVTMFLFHALWIKLFVYTYTCLALDRSTSQAFLKITLFLLTATLLTYLTQLLLNRFSQLLKKITLPS